MAGGAASEVVNAGRHEFEPRLTFVAIPFNDAYNIAAKSS
jgi:hypothetical protein